MVVDFDVHAIKLVHVHKKTGFFPYDTIVTAKDGDQPIQLNIELEPIPD